MGDAGKAVGEMTFTGERFVPAVVGDIELEHIHRYLLAEALVADRRVLDIACGEGYGSNILRRSAASVVGVDIDEAAVMHARGAYAQDGLEFQVGSCAAIPLGDASVDVVVSFETIEHHDAHEAMMREIRRVLAPGGLLVISSPDKREYSDVPRFKNQYHVRELYAEEFGELLGRHFRHSRIYCQKVLYGSVIAARDAGAGDRFVSFNRADGVLHRQAGLHAAPYLVALASDAELPAWPSSTYVPEVPPYWPEMAATKDALQQASAAIEAHRLALEDVRRNAEERLGKAHELHAVVETLQARIAEQIAARQADLDAVHRSLSWRLTAPVRFASTLARRCARGARARLVPVLIGGYRRLNLSVATRARIRNAVFTGFGWALRDSLTYRRWKAGRAQPVAAAWAASPADETGERIADGHWEWADHDPVAERIRQAKASVAAGYPVEPQPMLDFKPAALADEAARIRLPVPKAAPAVSIIVPVYGQTKLTLECLASIANATGGFDDYEVIVADDASVDPEIELLGRVANLRIVRQPTNLGFLRNCNAASRAARGRFLVFLNNDTQVTPGWLAAMVALHESAPGIGAVGPKLLFPDGHLQEAGARLRWDGSAEMIGLGGSPADPAYSRPRAVDYCSGGCLLLAAELFQALGGFDERYAPAYCEDSDLCLRIRDRGLQIVYCPGAVVVHHLSKSSESIDRDYKLRCIGRNLDALSDRWHQRLWTEDDVRMIAFYLPQFHPFPENDLWWGKGFTEWRNVAKARPNFVGHDQPRLPADLGYYDLRLESVMADQAALAARYGIHGFCFYYYWFDGKRLLERPIERMLASREPSFPYCLCWANENWTRRWDGNDQQILIAQNHSDADDLRVIHDLMRHFRNPDYIRVRGKPLILVYRVTLFPDFNRTAEIWRQACRDQGIGEIHLVLVETFELVTAGRPPSEFGCDAAVEFPPLEMGVAGTPGSAVLNPAFRGAVDDYRDLAVRFATRPNPGYPRYRGVMPGWDNTARQQDRSFCAHRATPGAFQAWAEAAIADTKRQFSGDERLVFVNAWNEWAEGAYLEPDRRFGHTYLEAVRNAKEASRLNRGSDYALG
ncbi:MAG: glycoside hydrolase family 99-like domain-containing protein [Lautropia sp.]